MGKPQEKKQPQIRLTMDELKALCEDAAEKGVSRYIGAKKTEKEKEKRSLLYSTKKLLENYTKLKDYAEKAVYTIEEAEKLDQSITNMDVLYGFHMVGKDRMLHRQLRGINAVKFMLAHVDRMLDVYKKECDNSSLDVMHRRWEVIEMMYLNREQKKNTKQIAEQFNMELSTIQKDAKEARNDLTVLFFGLDAMVLYDFNDANFGDSKK